MENETEPSSSASKWQFVIPVAAILICHYFVDVYSSLILPLIGKVEVDFGMSPEMATILLATGTIMSGLAQPTFAWLSDQFNTRWFGAIGIALAAIGITSLGYAQNVTALFLLVAVGMVGVGMFHPIAASTIGRIAGDKRGLAISWFFVFGMGGFFTGSLVGPSISTGSGTLQNLIWLAIPGVILAVVLQMSIGKVKHKNPKSDLLSGSLSKYDWWSITLLFVSSVFRFLVNTALLYLIVRWMERYCAELNPTFSAQQVADSAAPLSGQAQAIMFVGQAVGGLAAGWLIKSGREKLPLILVPLFFCPFIGLISICDPNFAGYVACFLSGISFAAMTPVAISVGQRLMPYHTSLASALMLGAAWAIASIGPRVSEWIIQTWNLEVAFWTLTVCLAMSGLTAMGLNSKTIRGTDG